MKIHLVGGFLGSGKTTAIIGASRLLKSRGISVGVVTNDQGRFLVDTDVIRSLGVATAEVTGGCFCCNLPQLQKMIEQLDQRAGPSVVFAEPVGSCADLVATVLKPMAAPSPLGRIVGPLSVFTDIRLLRQRLFGRPLPFSEDVQYIFDTQIEEAQIIVVNKSDLLPGGVAREIMERARKRYPAKTVLLQCSLESRDLSQWIDTIDHVDGGAGRAAVAVDYDRYARGEMGLAWYDASLTVDLSTDNGREVTQRLIDELRAAAYDGGRSVGHVKMRVRHAGGSFRLSITEEAVTPMGSHPVAGKRLDFTINARAEDSADGLSFAIREGVARALSGDGIVWKLLNEEAFHPLRPEPFMRMP